MRERLKIQDKYIPKLTKFKVLVKANMLHISAFCSALSLLRPKTCWQSLLLFCLTLDGQPDDSHTLSFSELVEMNW